MQAPEPVQSAWNRRLRCRKNVIRPNFRQKPHHRQSCVRRLPNNGGQAVEHYCAGVRRSLVA